MIAGGTDISDLYYTKSEVDSIAGQASRGGSGSYVQHDVDTSSVTINTETGGHQYNIAFSITTQIGLNRGSGSHGNTRIIIDNTGYDAVVKSLRIPSGYNITKTSTYDTLSFASGEGYVICTIPINKKYIV